MLTVTAYVICPWVSIERGDSWYKCLVSCCRLDVQRLPGEELDHPDNVVNWERRVAAYKRALGRLLGRPVGQREWYWGQEVASVKGLLATAQDCLSLAQAERNGETVDLVSVDRARQLDRQQDGLLENRPRY